MNTNIYRPIIFSKAFLLIALILMVSLPQGSGVISGHWFGNALASGVPPGTTGGGSSCKKEGASCTSVGSNSGECCQGYCDLIQKVCTTGTVVPTCAQYGAACSVDKDCCVAEKCDTTAHKCISTVAPPNFGGTGCTVTQTGTSREETIDSCPKGFKCNVQTGNCEGCLGNQDCPEGWTCGDHGCIDTTPPKVIAVTPPEGAQNVDPSAIISFKFDKPLGLASTPTTPPLPPPNRLPDLFPHTRSNPTYSGKYKISYSIYELPFFTYVSTVADSADGQNFHILPSYIDYNSDSTTLRKGLSYLVVIQGGVTVSSYGTPMANDTSWSFTISK